MEIDKEQLNKIMNRRRPRGQDEGEIFLNGPLKRTEGKWGFLIAGALLLALVAFFSGVQLGENLRDLKLGKRPFHQAQAEVQRDIPFRLSLKGTESAPVPEPAGPSAGPSTETGERTVETPLPSPLGAAKMAAEKPAGASSTAAKGAPSLMEDKKTALPSKGKFTLQIAAFNNNEEARELVNHLKRKGYPAYQVTGSAAAKGTLHRVRIGQFPSLQEARQFAVDFEKKERMKTIITGTQGQ